MHKIMMITLRPIRIVDALNDGFKIEEKSSKRPRLEKREEIFWLV